MADKQALEEREARKALQAKFEAALGAAKAELMAIPGVVDVGVGLREKDGKTTDEFAFQVLVREKRPLSDVPIAERIPKTVQGFPTDVLLPVEGAPLIGFNDENDDTNYSRKVGGGSISRDGRGGAGTLGCFVRTADSKVALLTNHHVLWADGETPKDGVGIGQPEYSDSICCVCNEMAKTVTPPAGAEPPLPTTAAAPLDCALGLLKEGVQYAPKIRTIKRADGTVELDGTIAGSDSPTVNDIVWKVGARTGLTRGKIKQVTPQLIIEPVAPFTKMADHGDSGSVFVEVVGGKVVALLLQKDNATGNLALCKPMPAILALLNVSVIPTSAGDGMVSGFADERLGMIVEPRPEDVFAALADRLRMTERGAELIALYRRHAKEISHLVNHVRPVTVAWRRNAGPAYLAAVTRSVRDPIYRLPDELNGAPRSLLAERMIAALAKAGSDGLRADIAAHGELLQALWAKCDTVDSLIAAWNRQEEAAIAAE